MSSELRRAVFLDRDDTLNINVPYLGDPAQVKLLPHVPESLRRLQDAGFLLFVVSNQSGVGRGLISKEQVESVYAEIIHRLGWNPFIRIYNCYAAPGDPYGAEERKPSPAMLLQAADEFGIDLPRSFMIGDRGTDVMAGKNAGCRSILVLNGRDPNNLSEKGRQADRISDTLADATDWILSFPA
jgi:D-glycero-D-manno-heptose 1,7-bisphosphate phosphatase